MTENGTLRLESRGYTWHMQTVLRYLRDELGFPFDAAWSRALMSLPRPIDERQAREREAWGEQLQAHRQVWKAAYERDQRPLVDNTDVELELCDLIECVEGEGGIYDLEPAVAA